MGQKAVRHKTPRTLWRKERLAPLLMLSLFGTAHGAVTDPTLGTPVTTMKVPVGHSRVVSFNDTIRNISLGNPKVADVVVLESEKVYVVGKALGATNVVIWGKNSGRNEYTQFNVEVTHDVDGMKRLLKELMPDENPEVRSSQGAIILSGIISSPAKVEAIVRLAEQYIQNAEQHSLVDKSAKEMGTSGGGAMGSGKSETKVINLMRVGGPQQVMLEVKVAEMSRSAMKHMGINMASMNPNKPWTFGAVNGGASFPNTKFLPGNVEVPVFPKDAAPSGGDYQVIGPVIDTFEPTMPTIASTGLFLNYLSKNSFFNLVLDIAKDDGLAKILAEPTLTTSSGEPAAFLSGGEFPIPVWSGTNNGVTVTFKEFGIGMKALPVVLDTNRLNLNMEISVSELTDTASVLAGVPGSTANYNIPSLSTRKANSTVELLDGQTIGIAGLISDRTRETISKFPGLGDLPVLGALFRSQEFLQDQSELVMFVTAHLAKPIAPSQIRLPTDAFTEPSDAQFFLMGRMEGSGKKNTSNGKNPPPSSTAKTTAAPPQAVSRTDTPAQKVETKTTAPVTTAPAKQPNSNGGPTFGHQLR